MSKQATLLHNPPRHLGDEHRPDGHSGNPTPTSQHCLHIDTVSALLGPYLHLHKGDLAGAPDVVPVQPHDALGVRGVGRVEVGDAAAGVPPGRAVVQGTVAIAPLVVVLVPGREGLVVVHEQAVTCRGQGETHTHVRPLLR